jgi:hypothetical protein
MIQSLRAAILSEKISVRPYALPELVTDTKRGQSETCDGIWSGKTFRSADAPTRQTDLSASSRATRPRPAFSMRVSVIDYLDGRLAIRYKGVPLAYPAKRLCERSALALARGKQRDAVSKVCDLFRRMQRELFQGPEMDRHRTSRAITSPAEIRTAARGGKWRGSTGGQCPAYQQANLVILPKDAAVEFAAFCTRNPKPCPLIEITPPGDPEPARSAPGALSDCI